MNTYNSPYNTPNTKSISKFSRNMADCAEIIRNLRSIGVNIFFEKKDFKTAPHP